MEKRFTVLLKAAITAAKCAMAGMLLMVGIAAGQSLAPAQMAANVAARTPPVPATEPGAATNAPAPQKDLAAAKFMSRCAGCHSLAGVKLTGPELSHVAAWSPESLQQSIKRMEKNVGPLTEEDVEGLANLLRDGQARERLKAEEARIQAQFLAKMDPPNAALGRGLFTGAVPLANGGLPCSACHTTGGMGGSLGPDLTGVFAKMGRTPLVSAIEKASFKIMGPHYLDRPITKQEALHLTQYFSTLAPQPLAAASPVFLPVGAGAAATMLVGLGYYFRTRRTGRDKKLQRRR